MIRQLVLHSRSYRRFYESKTINRQTLRDLVDLARLSPSAANMQKLRYWIIESGTDCAKVFPCLKWANYLKDWDGPQYGERPSAYILVLAPHNATKFHYFDCGIASQSIMLGAASLGMGGCMIASMDRERLNRELGLPQGMEIMLTLALGYPAEEVVVDTIGAEGNIEYWRDEKDRHHVPKLDLNTLILN
jgi:nitroreductase